MKNPSIVLLVSLAASGCTTLDGPRDPLCAPLQAFVSSVGPGESREIQFRTSWGSGFEDEEPEKSFYATRCVHSEYPQAKAVCDVFMEHGAVEFAGHNAKEALQCLSPGTKIVPGVYLEIGEFSFRVGTEEIGQSVSLSFLEDKEVGGMVLRISVDGLGDL